MILLTVIFSTLRSKPFLQELTNRETRSLAKNKTVLVTVIFPSTETPEEEEEKASEIPATSKLPKPGNEPTNAENQRNESEKSIEKENQEITTTPIKKVKDDSNKNEEKISMKEMNTSQAGMTDPNRTDSKVKNAESQRIFEMNDSLFRNGFNKAVKEVERKEMVKEEQEKKQTNND